MTFEKGPGRSEGPGHLDLGTSFVVEVAGGAVTLKWEDVWGIASVQ